MFKVYFLFGRGEGGARALGFRAKLRVRNPEKVPGQAIIQL